MKRILALAVAFIATVGMALAEEASLTYNVTVPEGTNTCYIAGGCTGWKFTEMTKVDDTHYTITIEGATAAQGYKYCSGPDWAYVEKTSTGGEMSDRTYQEEDVVAKWASVYDPGIVSTYSTIRVCIKYDNAPTIWWWGAGSKCPNADATSDPNKAGKNYAWPGPSMLPLPGAEGWYYWDFADVNDALGVTFKIDGDAIGEKNVKATTAFTTMGKVTSWPSGAPTIIRNVYSDGKGAVKTVENGKVVIVVDGVKYDLAGQKL